MLNKNRITAVLNDVLYTQYNEDLLQLAIDKSSIKEVAKLLGYTVDGNFVTIGPDKTITHERIQKVKEKYSCIFTCEKPVEIIGYDQMAFIVLTPDSLMYMDDIESELIR